MEGMTKKNMYFPPPIWDRLVALSEREGVAIADVLRRLLSAALGLDESIMAQVELDETAGDPIPRLRRDLVHQRLEHAKVANALARLTLDVDDLAAADPARQAAWEGLQGAFEQLSTDMQTHVDRAERLFTQTSQAIAGLYQGLVDLRVECEALRQGITALHNGLKQVGMLDVDLLRRLAAVESGISDEQTQEAVARGNSWLTKIETALLTEAGSGAEREAEHD